MNSFGMPHLWLTVGLGIALLHAARERRDLLPAIRLSLGVVILAHTLSSAVDIGRLPGRIFGLKTSPEQQAYDYAKSHPGEAYFPWHPLASLMATGQLHHAGYCVWDWEITDIEISHERFRANLPSDFRYVAFEDFAYPPDEALIERLPEFGWRAHLDELPGWGVFTRCD